MYYENHEHRKGYEAQERDRKKRENEQERDRRELEDIRVSAHKFDVGIEHPLIAKRRHRKADEREVAEGWFVVFVIVVLFLLLK